MLVCLSALALVAADPSGLETQIPQWLDETGTPAVGIAYVENGEIAWSGVWGRQAEGVPATEETLFNVASLAKPVTAEALLRQVSAGLYGLDDPLSHYWVDPDIAEDDRHEALTLRLALSHQTGFPNWRYQTDGHLEFRFSPGTNAAYSGEGFEYVARYAAARTGETFENIVEQEIFAALGLSATLTPDPRFEGRYAHPMINGVFAEPSFQDEASAADDLYITVESYARLLIAMLEDEGLTPEIAALRERIIADQRGTGCRDGSPLAEVCPDAMGFGLGRVVMQYGDRTVIWHGGGDSGERALMVYVPETGQGLVIAANSASAGPLFPRVFRHFFDIEPFAQLLELQAGG